MKVQQIFTAKIFGISLISNAIVCKIVYVYPSFIWGKRLKPHYKSADSATTCNPPAK